MKTLATHNGVTFTQSNDCIWADFGGISMPLAMSYDEEGGRYAYFWDTAKGSQIRIYIPKD